jgi:hypothetical protein
MKKTGLTILTVFVMLLSVKSQNVDDALRYSQIFYSGTARFNAMGGAFTALGGDLSSLSLNPAGLGVYRSFEFTITPLMLYNNVSTNFNGTHASDFSYNFNLNQIGVAANLISKDNTDGLVNLNVGYSYVRTNNFNLNTTINGIGENSSMADYWVRQANGTYFRDLSGSAGIAFDGYAIDTIPGSGGTSYATVFSNYGNNANSTYGQTVKRIIDNQGYSGEHAFSVGANLSNMVYLGATIGVNVLQYIGHYQHIEENIGINRQDLTSFTYTDHFEASGTGYALKIGAIVKPVDFLRIGLAIHTPVIYRIHENFYDKITAVTGDGSANTFSDNPLRYSYTLTTPFRLLAGVAVQVKKLALISFDYEFVDYKMARFSNASDDYNYSAENKSIKDILKSASNLRLGAEFRVTKNLYLRGGYGYYGKALAPGQSIEEQPNRNLVYNSVSFGAGFRQQNFFFDLAFTRMWDDQNYLMYYDPGYLNPTTVNTSKNAFTATLGYKF